MSIYMYIFLVILKEYMYDVQLPFILKKKIINNYCDKFIYIGKKLL